MNYLRNRIFFNFQESSVSLIKIWKEIMEGMKAKEGTLKKISYVVQERLNIGFGTLRVGLGMAVAQETYRYLKSKNYLNPLITQ